MGLRSWTLLPFDPSLSWEWPNPVQQVGFQKKSPDVKLPGAAWRLTTLALLFIYDAFHEVPLLLCFFPLFLEVFIFHLSLAYI